MARSRQHAPSRRLAPAVVAVVALQLIAVYLLVAGVRDHLASQFVENARVTLDDVADGVIDRSGRFLAPVEGAVRVGAALIDGERIGADDDAALESYFIAQLGVTPWLHGMFLGREDGSFVFVARNEFGLRTKTIRADGGERLVSLVQRDARGQVTERWTDPTDDYDPRTRAWYERAERPGELAWTDPYLFFSSGKPGLSASSRTVGGDVLGADVQIDELSAFVGEVPHAASSVAAIVDAGRRVIALSGADVRSEGEIPSFEQVVDPALAALYANAGADTGEAELSSLTLDGQTYLGTVRPFTLSHGSIDWTLLVQVRADEYDGGALNLFEDQLTVLALASIGLGLLALLGIVAVYRLERRGADDVDIDPLTGALTQRAFDAAVIEAVRADRGRRQAPWRVVMVVEPVSIRRLADRLGSEVGGAVLVELGARLRAGLEEGDRLGVVDESRFLVEFAADSEAAARARIEALHALAAASETFDTPLGRQTLGVASGAAVAESTEHAANVLRRARGALAVSVEAGGGCHVAGGFRALTAFYQAA